MYNFFFFLFDEMMQVNNCKTICAVFSSLSLSLSPFDVFDYAEGAAYSSEIAGEEDRQLLFGSHFGRWRLFVVFACDKLINFKLVYACLMFAYP